MGVFMGNIPTQPMTQASGVKVRGIDVSHYEPRLDWVKARASGVVKMYTKATEGTGHLDRLLRVHVADAQKAGVLCGAYHFFHHDMDGRVQAELFLEAIKGMSLELAPCLDWETVSGDGRNEALRWLNLVENVVGKVPVIYGGYFHFKELKLEHGFSKYPLWMAHYGISEKQLKVPAPWTSLCGWQYTDHEGPPIVQGLSPGHSVDANWFY